MNQTWRQVKESFSRLRERNMLKTRLMHACGFVANLFHGRCSHARHCVRRWCRNARQALRWLQYTFFEPPPIEDSPAYQNARTWIKEFKPSTEVEGYEKGLAYAWKKYDEICAASDTLDRKAHELMRSAGIVTGLLGFGAGALKLDDMRWLASSFIAGVVSIAVSAIACRPTASTTSASVKNSLEDIDAGHNSDVWIAASLHCAISGREDTNNWKAKRIMWATWILVLALLLLIVAVSKSA